MTRYSSVHTVPIAGQYTDTVNHAKEYMFINRKYKFMKQTKLSNFKFELNHVKIRNILQFKFVKEINKAIISINAGLSY